jgi:hypothetical protein
MEKHLKRSDLQVLVAYDNFTAGTRAMEMLKRINRQCGGPERMAHVMWRFDLISDASFFELAINEALAADIVVIATIEGIELPQKIKDWLIRWLLVKEYRPLALVATLDYTLTKADKHDCVRPYLAKLAGFGKMQFFANGKPTDPEIDFGKIKKENWNWDAALRRQDLLE